MIKSKKYISALIVFILLMNLLSSNVVASSKGFSTSNNPNYIQVADTEQTSNSPEITVLVEGETIAFEQDPVLLNGSVLVPIRLVTEKLGCEVEWDATAQTVYVDSDSPDNPNALPAVLTDNINVYVDNYKISFEQQPINLNGSVLIPIRAVVEQLGYTVTWNQEEYIVSIFSNSSVMLEDLTYSQDYIQDSFCGLVFEVPNGTRKDLSDEGGYFYHYEDVLFHINNFPKDKPAKFNPDKIEESNRRLFTIDTGTTTLFSLDGYDAYRVEGARSDVGGEPYLFETTNILLGLNLITIVVLVPQDVELEYLDDINYFFDSLRVDESLITN